MAADRLPTLTADFFTRLQGFIAQRMEARDCLTDLPDYQPVMGHRYAWQGHPEPLSIFQGEGLALYLFVQAFKPRIVLDLFTGTGFAAAHLAAGYQFTRVYSVDDYREGGLRDAGWAAACALVQACDLRNVKLIQGSHLDLVRVLDEDGLTRPDIDVLFLDGLQKRLSEEIFAHPATVVITHDELFPLGPTDFRLKGGSHLTFSVPPGMLPICHQLFAPFFRFEVADTVVWRPPAEAAI